MAKRSFAHFRLPGNGRIRQEVVDALEKRLQSPATLEAQIRNALFRLAWKVGTSSEGRPYQKTRAREFLAFMLRCGPGLVTGEGEPQTARAVLERLMDYRELGAAILFGPPDTELIRNAFEARPHYAAPTMTERQEAFLDEVRDIADERTIQQRSKEFIKRLAEAIQQIVERQAREKPLQISLEHPFDQQLEQIIAHFDGTPIQGRMELVHELYQLCRLIVVGAANQLSVFLKWTKRGLPIFCVLALVSGKASFLVDYGLVMLLPLAFYVVLLWMLYRLVDIFVRGNLMMLATQGHIEIIESPGRVSRCAAPIGGMLRRD